VRGRPARPGSDRSRTLPFLHRTEGEKRARTALSVSCQAWPSRIGVVWPRVADWVSRETTSHSRGCSTRTPRSGRLYRSSSARRCNRRWHLRWGATDEEVAEPMPGDEFVPVAHFVATRAITICAPPAAVWPWIMQVGFGRAGFYSYDLFDNLGRPSAEDLHMEWQQAHVGDLAAPMTNPPGSGCSNRWTPRAPSRHPIRQRYVPRPATVVTVSLSEFGDFAMMRKMLLGIKRRAAAVPCAVRPGEFRRADQPRARVGPTSVGGWMVRTSLTDRLRSSSTSAGRRAVLLGSRRSRLGCHALGRHLVGPGRLSGERAWHQRFAG
jgi:hypothetical protein